MENQTPTPGTSGSQSGLTQSGLGSKSGLVRPIKQQTPGQTLSAIAKAMPTKTLKRLIKDNVFAAPSNVKKEHIRRHLISPRLSPEFISVMQRLAVNYLAVVFLKLDYLANYKNKATITEEDVTYVQQSLGRVVYGRIRPTKKEKKEAALKKMKAADKKIKVKKCKVKV